MGKLWGREPALVMAVVHAAIALAIGFGLHITTEQFALIETLVAAVIALIVRSQVAPTGSQ